VARAVAPSLQVEWNQFVARAAMRFVVIIIAALISLGLAVFGVITAQKSGWRSSWCASESLVTIVSRYKK
jgi:hypothetical protein